MEELEIMGRQLEAMKQSLDTQQIINKKLLCKLIRKRSSWLNSFVISEIIALPLVALIFVSYCSLKGISQWYTLSFILFAAIDTAIDWRTVRIPGRMFGTASILELKRRIIRQKKERSVQICVSLPLTVIWMLAFIHADRAASASCTFSLSGNLIGTIVGGGASAVLVVFIYRKIQRTNDSLLTDISSFEEES